MLRGTRTQYLRRRQSILFWVGLPFLLCMFAAPVADSTGWERKFWISVMVPTYILSLLLAFARLTDKQWYKQMAKAGRKANQHRGPIYFPPSGATRALAFAKRIFGGGKSE